MNDTSESLFSQLGFSPDKIDLPNTHHEVGVGVCIDANLGLADMSEEERLYGFRRVRSIFASGSLAIAATSSYVFELGPWNETLRIERGLQVLQHTHSALMVGLSTAALTAAIEILPSVLVAVGLNRDKGMVKKLNAHLEKKNDISTNEKKLKATERIMQEAFETNKLKRAKLKLTKPIGRAAAKSADVITAFGGGGALLVAKRHFEDAKPNTKKGLKDALVGTAIVSALGGTVGWLLGGGINIVSKVDALEPVADAIIEYGTDKTVWLKLLAAGYTAVIASKIMKKIKRTRGSKDYDFLDPALMTS